MYLYRNTAFVYVTTKNVFVANMLIMEREDDYE